MPELVPYAVTVVDRHRAVIYAIYAARPLYKNNNNKIYHFIGYLIVLQKRSHQFE